MKNRFVRRLLGVLALFLLVFYISSCKTSQKATVKRTLRKHGFAYLKQKMDSSKADFSYMTAKMNLTYDNGKSRTNLKAQLRIKKDSIIWISFSPAMGIEVARIALTCDSVKFINRLNKTYFVGDYSILDSLINSSVNYLILQSMILGTDVPYYEIYNYKVRDADDYYLLVMEKKRKSKKDLISKADGDNPNILVEKFWLDPTTFRTRKLEMHELDKKEKKLTVYYDDYRLIDGKWFPFELRIKIKSEKTINIHVSYTKVRFENRLSFPFKISSKYQKAL